MALFRAGCAARSGEPPEDKRAATTQPQPADDWTRLPPASFAIPPYAKHLAGVRFALDPGHGGRAHEPNYKRGPTGLREAEVNLAVARRLREFLEGVGAQVTLTRDSDVWLAKDNSEDLRLRAAIANRERSDLFLSIHHNGAARPDANYTTVFYHGTPEDSPASLCAARYLLDGLRDALRLESELDCALLSDYAVHPPKRAQKERAGFAVLRLAQVPAVLTEASFHSNPKEERRLRDPLYNRREAYGLFLGLARWAQAGLPRVTLLEPADGRLEGGRTVVLRLHDGLSERGGWGSDLPKIFESSIVAWLDRVAVRFDFDPRTRELRFTPTREQAAKAGFLYVDFANIFGQRVLHPWIPVHRAGAE